MRSRFVIAFVGAVVTFGLWQAPPAFGQAQGDKAAAAPAATPSGAAPPAAPASGATSQYESPPSSSPPAPSAPPAASSPATPPAPPAASSPAAPAAPPAAAAPASSPATAEAAKGLVGEDVTLSEQPIVYVAGTAVWDSAFDTIIAGLKTLYAFLEKENIAPAGAPMTIYTSTDDKGFEFQAAVPVAAAPANPPPGDIKVGKSPSGKALKYLHQGSYDAMDATYEAITNQLDEKNLEAKDLFVEVYRTDPRTTPQDKLAIEVYVPIK
jgi:effector-binding domain-containing protein